MGSVRTRMDVISKAPFSSHTNIGKLFINCTLCIIVVFSIIKIRKVNYVGKDEAGDVRMKSGPIVFIL